MFDDVLLEPEQAELLTRLVDAARNQPRDKRQKFFAYQTFGGDSINHPGLGGEMPAYFGDVEILASQGLLLLSHEGIGEVSFDVTPKGLAYSDYLQGQPEARAMPEGASSESMSQSQDVELKSMEYFVAHEFSKEQIDDLRRAIDAALSGSGLTPYYADGELRQGHIFRDKIVPKIRDTRFGIYDISNPSKPNVFLELGAGLALGKPCIMICRSRTTIPADLEGLDRIEYESHQQLTEQLKSMVRPYISTPVSDAEKGAESKALANSAPVAPPSMGDVRWESSILPKRPQPGEMMTLTIRPVGEHLPKFPVGFDCEIAGGGESPEHHFLSLESRAGHTVNFTPRRPGYFEVRWIHAVDRQLLVQDGFVVEGEDSSGPRRVPVSL